MFGIDITQNPPDSGRIVAVAETLKDKLIRRRRLIWLGIFFVLIISLTTCLRLYMEGRVSDIDVATFYILGACCATLFCVISDWPHTMNAIAAVLFISLLGMLATYVIDISVMNIAVMGLGAGAGAMITSMLKYLVELRARIKELLPLSYEDHLGILVYAELGEQARKACEEDSDCGAYLAAVTAMDRSLVVTEARALVDHMQKKRAWQKKQEQMEKMPVRGPR